MLTSVLLYNKLNAIGALGPAAEAQSLKGLTSQPFHKSQLRDDLETYASRHIRLPRVHQSNGRENSFNRKLPGEWRVFHDEFVGSDTRFQRNANDESPDSIDASVRKVLMHMPDSQRYRKDLQSIIQLIDAQPPQGVRTGVGDVVGARVLQLREIEGKLEDLVVRIREDEAERSKQTNKTIMADIFLVSGTLDDRNSEGNQIVAGDWDNFHSVLSRRKEDAKVAGVGDKPTTADVMRDKDIIRIPASKNSGRSSTPMTWADCTSILDGKKGVQPDVFVMQCLRMTQMAPGPRLEWLRREEGGIDAAVDLTRRLARVQALELCQYVVEYTRKMTEKGIGLISERRASLFNP